MSPALSFEDVVVVRAGARVLDGVSFAVPSAAVTVIRGPSGSGKSSLLRLANRLDVPASGVVRYRGSDTAGLDVRELRRRVGMVFQRPTAFAGTVRENLAVARAATDERMSAALAQAALGPELLSRNAAELSGGELQRVCLARTLLTGPNVLLLDEPTSALDEEAAATFEAAARGLVAGGTTALWVTHDRAQIERMAEHVLTLTDGKVHQ
ncbi:MAG TPA: ATP-binding cassette domain-containing protein [Candidatus Lustribacter sp.]|nr:ATP-binding cassette domain-containing protein [Candidatus Lustribacter sp.]